jgi:hypothetical protein
MTGNNTGGWKRPGRQFGRFLPHPKHIDMAGRIFAGGRHAKTAAIVKFKQILFRFGRQHSSAERGPTKNCLDRDLAGRDSVEPRVNNWAKQAARGSL